jgi:hypothetical protein
MVCIPDPTYGGSFKRLASHGRLTSIAEMHQLHRKSFRMLEMKICGSCSKGQKSSATTQTSSEKLRPLELGVLLAADNLVRKSEDGTMMERLYSIEELMLMLTGFEASASHDTLYAILWLAYDTDNDYVLIMRA